MFLTRGGVKHSIDFVSLNLVRIFDFPNFGQNMFLTGGVKLTRLHPQGEWPRRSFYTGAAFERVNNADIAVTLPDGLLMRDI